MGSSSEVVFFLPEIADQSRSWDPFPAARVPDLAAPEFLLSRRSVLRIGGFAAGAALTAGFLPPFRSRAEALPVLLAIAAKAAFTAAISWFVTKLLDETVGKRFEKAELKEVAKGVSPSPARGAKYAFHNRHGARWEVADVALDCSWSKTSKTYVNVDRYVRADHKREMRSWFDYNSRELIIIQRHVETKVLAAPLFPCECRIEPTDKAEKLFVKVCQERKIEPGSLTLDYTRIFSDSPEGPGPKSKEQVALGVSKKDDPGTTSLIFVDETA